jgi:ferrous-iron efflux pump FieF
MNVVRNMLDEQENAKLRFSATIFSVFVAITLIIIKLYAYIETGSMSVLSALIDSSVDLLTSAFILVGVRKAMKPADKSHRFGHRKVESLVALAQAAFILGSCVILVYEVINHIINPQPIQQNHIGVSVMCISIALTLFLLAYQYYVIKKTGSVAIKADQLHYRGDLLMNFSVIVILLLSEKVSWPYLDPLFAIFIILILLGGTKNIARTALDVLMDRELPIEERQEIEKCVNAHPESKGIHDLRSRFDGMYRFIEFHLELDPSLTLTEAHDITDAIEQDLKKKFEPAEIIIHQEPAGLEDERLDHQLC